MKLPPYYIKELPLVEMEAGCAWLQLPSGTGPQLVVPRSTWRHFLEVEIRRLNDFEQIERAARQVVQFEQTGGAR